MSGADTSGESFYFLEMNTRLQVEHPVTEAITGLDLVEQMIRVAAGEKLAFGQDDVRLDGWAIENRVYAEDPYRGFLPSIGRLVRYNPPESGTRRTPVLLRTQEPGSEVDARDPGLLHPQEHGAPYVRVDDGVREGGEVSMFYDPMIAKLVTWAPTREEAIDAQVAALDAFEIEGPGTNIDFLSALMQHPRFRSGEITTGFIAEEYPDGFHGAPAATDADPHARRGRRLRRDRARRSRAADRRPARSPAAPARRLGGAHRRRRPRGPRVDRRHRGRRRRAARLAIEYTPGDRMRRGRDRRRRR